MPEAKEKKVLIDLGTVRVREYDSLNVQIERLEVVKDPKTDTTSSKWKFKGYSRTILSALESIVKKELLLDEITLGGLKGYLKQIKESNAKVLAAIERVK